MTKRQLIKILTDGGYQRNEFAVDTVRKCVSFQVFRSSPKCATNPLFFDLLHGKPGVTERYSSMKQDVELEADPAGDVFDRLLGVNKR